LDFHSLTELIMAVSPRLSLIDPSELHTFVVPVKLINEGHNVSTFLVSHAYGDIMTFLMQLNRFMFPYLSSNDTDHKTPNVSSLHQNPISFCQTIQRLRSLLSEIESVIEEAPPDPGPRRFGNISFRKWYDIVDSRTPVLLDRYLPLESLSVKTTSDITAHNELSSYLLESFGSAQRLDYGTGHELSFLAFLGCIWKLGGFEVSQPGEVERQIVLGVIEPYLQLIRRLIKTYTLEPAGSHGVWGLDDHSFLPYIFGSAQYGPAISDIDPTPIEGSRADAPDPANVSKAAAVERERATNMYFDAVGFIYDVKKGPFWEHSPMLYDISGVRAGWAKINKGMLKMYNAEVLSKFPVVQHFRFGSLFSWERDPNAVAPPVSVHSTSQPSTTAMAATEQFPMRGPPPTQTGTAAPWATNAPSTNTTGVSAPWAPRVPESAAGTKAPWAVTAMDASATATAPWAQKPHLTRDAGSAMPRHVPPRGTRPNGGHSQVKAESSTPDRVALPQEREGAMLPPMTKAPWAKKPN